MFYVTQPTDQQLYSEVKVEVNGNLTLVDKKRRNSLKNQDNGKLPHICGNRAVKPKVGRLFSHAFGRSVS